MSSVLIPFLANIVIIPGRKHLAVRFVPGKIFLSISVMHLGVTKPWSPVYENRGLAPTGLAFLVLTHASSACTGHKKFGVSGISTIWFGIVLNVFGLGVSVVP